MNHALSMNGTQHVREHVIPAAELDEGRCDATRPVFANSVLEQTLDGSSGAGFVEMADREMLPRRSRNRQIPDIFAQRTENERVAITRREWMIQRANRHIDDR